MTQETSGFYKLENNNLLYAQSMVMSPFGYVLSDDLKDTYEYPIDGWYWFDTENEARVFFNMPILEETNELNNLL
jgi:hypothetical protein